MDDAGQRLQARRTAALVAIGPVLLALALAAPPARAGEPAPSAGTVDQPDDGELTLAIALPATLTVVGTAGAALAAAGLWLWSGEPAAWEAWAGVAGAFGALALASPELGYWILGDTSRGVGRLLLRVATWCGSALVGYLVGLAVAPNPTCPSDHDPWDDPFCELGQLGSWAQQMTSLGAFLAAGNLAFGIWEWVDLGTTSGTETSAPEDRNAGETVAWQFAPLVGPGPAGAPLVGGRLALRF